MEINLNEDLEAKFRRKAMEVKGYKKGAFKEAIEEAVTDWLKKGTL